MVPSLIEKDTKLNRIHLKIARSYCKLAITLLLLLHTGYVPSFLASVNLLMLFLNSSLPVKHSSILQCPGQLPALSVGLSWFLSWYWSFSPLPLQLQTDTSLMALIRACPWFVLIFALLSLISFFLISFLCLVIYILHDGSISYCV